MLVIGGKDVAAALAGQERAVVAVVEETYRRHDAGRTSVPHSSFLRFPDEPRNRIIALAAHVGGETPVTGLKWIASYPGNLAAGLPRASAVIVLNSVRTGRPEALLEASTISAWRTAASAASAAALSTAGRSVPVAAIVGCGPINLTVLRFLVATGAPPIERFRLHDTDPSRAARFAEAVGRSFPGIAVEVAASTSDALAGAGLISIATNAATPHLDLAGSAPDAVVLHVSLRDLTPATILASRNLVDDVDHVCREQTSIHLTEQATGHRDFIDAPIGALLRGTATLPDDPARPRVVFSPFGLGALDMALAGWVRDRVVELGLGGAVPHFLPDSEGDQP